MFKYFVSRVRAKAASWSPFSTKSKILLKVSSISFNPVSSINRLLRSSMFSVPLDLLLKSSAVTFTSLKSPAILLAPKVCEVRELTPLFK